MALLDYKDIYKGKPIPSDFDRGSNVISNQDAKYIYPLAPALFPETGECGSNEVTKSDVEPVPHKPFKETGECGSNGGSVDKVAFEEVIYEVVPTETTGVVVGTKGKQVPLTLVGQEQEIFGPGRCGPILKIKLPYGVYTNEREVRPVYTRRKKGECKFILDMVGSDGTSYAMSMSDCTIISALALTPTPESLTINSAKIINRYNTMTRWVEEHWGDEIDTITFSGGTYGFFEVLNKSGGAGQGLTVDTRRNTEPYKMLRELSNLYMANGMIYHDSETYDESSLTERFLKDPKNSYFVNNHPRKGLPKERLYIKLSYDYITCLGYIDSFDVIEDDSTVFRLKYSMTYKAEKTIYNQGSSAKKSREVPNANFNSLGSSESEYV